MPWGIQMSKADKTLSQRVLQMPKEQQPERDLWRGIELGITSDEDAFEQHSNTYRRWGSVAALLGVFSVLWFFTFEIDERERASPNNYALVEVQSAQQQQYLTTLLASYEKTPALTENWQQQLNELDEAADAIKKALKEDPDNTALIKMLHHVFQQQIALVERVHAPKWQQI